MEVDITNFWDSVQFKPIYKEKNMWVNGATVDSGALVQLRVVSVNNATYLRDMQWKLIYGTAPTEKARVQHFRMNCDLEKVLILIEENRTARVYKHKWESIMITVHLDPEVVDMYVSQDALTLAEVICKPSFTIKKLAR